VRFRCGQHQWQERSRLRHQGGRAPRPRDGASAARTARDPRPDRRHDPVLQAVPLGQALRHQQRSAARARAAAIAAGPRRAERALRVHPVRLLLDRLPLVLVEPGQVRRPGRPAAGLPLHRRHARPGDCRTAGQPRGPVSPVPLPHHHELRRRLPQGPQPDARDQQDQGHDAPHATASTGSAAGACSSWTSCCSDT
jgi:hypothetical protein